MDVSPGTEVAIVLKCDQRSGRLTHGIVQSILTNSTNHPRGIKVRLTSGQVGRVQHVSVGQSSCGGGHGIATTTARASSPRTTSVHDDRSFAEERTTFGRESSGPTATSSLGDWLPASMITEAIQATSTPGIVIPWNCSACTYENTNLELECEICMTQRVRES